MNKNKVIKDISARQETYWCQINELYKSALDKNYKTRQSFDMKRAPIQADMPASDWLEISRLVEAVEELERFKTYVKAQKRGAKEESDVDEDVAGVPMGFIKYGEDNDEENNNL